MINNTYKLKILKAVMGQKDGYGNVSDITPAILAELANTYSADLYEAQVVVGHDDDLEALIRNDKAPSFGSIDKVWTENDDTELWAQVTLIDEMVDWVDRKLYRHWSLAFFEPGNDYGVIPDKHYIRHLAILGAQPPAIKDLGKMIKLSEQAKIKSMTILQENIIKAPSSNASPEEVREFMDNYAETMILEVLETGEFGFTGGIVELSPKPSAENNYLSDGSGIIKGQFLSDSGEMYNFEIDGDQKTFSPVDTTEADEMVAMSDDKVEVEMVGDEIIEDEEFLTEEEEDELAVLAQKFGECMEKYGYKDYKSDNGLLSITINNKPKAEDKMPTYDENTYVDKDADKTYQDAESMHKAQIAELQAELNAMKEEKAMMENRKSIAKVLMDYGYMEDEALVDELAAFSYKVRSFSEGNKNPVLDLIGRLKPIKQTISAPTQDITVLSEAKKDKEDKMKTYSPSMSLPSNADMDEESSMVYSQAKQIAEEKGISFLSALKEVYIK